MFYPSKQKPVFLALALAGLLLLSLPLLAMAVNLLQNDGLEQPFVKYGEWYAGGGRTFDLEVAHDWERFFVPDGTHDNGDRLRYFSSSAVEFLYGFVEKRDGDDAQIFWSTKPYDAGIYQQISGLTIGETYGFQAGILQVYGNTTSKTHGKMFRSVGLDPTGGVDPTASTVIWGPEEGLDVDWFYPGVGAQALASTVTVFIRVRSIDDAPTFEENSVWTDDTFFDVAPTTSLNVDLTGATEALATWSGSPRSGFNLFAHEAQYRKVTETTWTDLQIFTSADDTPPTGTSQSFTIEPGVEYIVRARTWHEQDGGDSHEIPGPWAEETVFSGGLVQGRVINNWGNLLTGATVSVDGFPLTTTVTTTGGGYELLTGAGEFGLTATFGSWSTPLPVRVTVPAITSVVPLTLTLRPPDDIITNGDFENGLAGWQVSGTMPTTSAQIYRTGFGLKMTDTVVISQTGPISGSYQPTLSFWYRLAGGDGNDPFTAEILGDSSAGVTTLAVTSVNSFTTVTAGNWRYVYLPLNLTEVYTGPIGSRFTLSQSGPTQTVVYLDEVSLGSAPGGPFKVFLPIVIKE